MLEPLDNPSLSFWRELRHSSSLRILPLVACFKAAMFGIAIMVALCKPGWFNLKEYNGHFCWPQKAPPTLATHFKTWSSMHYLHLAQNGYQPRQPSNMMYPAWPMLLRLARVVSPLTPLINALLLANLLSLAGVFFIHHFTRLRWGEKTANVTCALLVAFPGAIFFQLPYNDSLLLFLTSLLFLSLQRRCLPGVLISSFVLPLCDISGLLLLIPIGIELQKMQAGTKLCALVLAAPLLGFACCLGFFYCTCGSPLAGIAAQSDYLKALGARFPGMHRFIASVAGGYHFGFTFSSLDRFFFLTFIGMMYAARRMPGSLVGYSLLGACVPAIAHCFVSFTRHMSVLFPLFIVVARPSRDDNSPYALPLMLGFSLLLHIVFWLAHTNNYWIG